MKLSFITFFLLAIALYFFTADKAPINKTTQIVQKNELEVTPSFVKEATYEVLEPLKTIENIPENSTFIKESNRIFNNSNQEKTLIEQPYTSNINPDNEIGQSIEYFPPAILEKQSIKAEEVEGVDPLFPGNGQQRIYFEFPDSSHSI